MFFLLPLDRYMRVISMHIHNINRFRPHPNILLQSNTRTIVVFLFTTYVHIFRSLLCVHLYTHNNIDMDEKKRKIRDRIKKGENNMFSM